MKFKGIIAIPAPAEAVFDKLNDPQFFASCIEGVSDLQEIDPTHFTATLETRIAYIKFRFNIAVEIVGLDRPSSITAKAEGVPLGVVGRMTAQSVARLRKTEAGTEVSYEIDVALAGKLGSLGQPVLRSKAKEMERQLTKNLLVAFPETVQ